MKRGERVEQRRLARARAAADEQVAAPPDRAPEQLGERRRQRAVGDELVGREAAAAEAPDRQHRPVERERRDHHVDARAVGQAGIDERLGLVDAAAERGEDALDRVPELAVAAEADLGRLEPAARARPTPARCRTRGSRRPRGRRAAARAARGRTSARRCGRRAPPASPRRAPTPRGRRTPGSAPARPPAHRGRPGRASIRSRSEPASPSSAAWRPSRSSAAPCRRGVVARRGAHGRPTPRAYG